MINLLSPEEKTSVRKEYQMRVFAVSLAAFFFIAVIAIVSLFPSYVAVFLKRSVISDEASANAMIASKKAAQTTSVSAEKINKEIAILGNPSLDTHSANVIAEIVSLLPDGVTISGMKYEGGSKHKVTLTGTAKTRAALLSFSDALKKQTFFSDVELPLSDLINFTDLSFSITLNVTSEASIP